MYFKLSVNLQRKQVRKFPRRGVFSIDEPSPTVRGVNRPIPSGYKINKCDPKGVSLDKVRPLTTIERSYLQTFPETFKFSGTKTNLEQMIGNAVPVQLAQYLAESIGIYCNKGALKQPTLFDLDDIFEMPNKVLHQAAKSLAIRSSLCG